MKKVIDKLKVYEDEKYREFTSSLVPNIAKDYFIGVRVPKIRLVAKEIYSNKELMNDFLNELPHQCYEENILHSVLINSIKDLNECLDRIDLFIPYIDNWAVSDTISPKVVMKNFDLTYKYIKKWLKLDKTYSIRVALGLLMGFYLKDEFKKEHLDLCLKIKDDDYYTKMMIAWYFATALAKQYDVTIRYLEDHLLPKWIHNKTIQKAIESYRISDKQKDYLRTLKY